MSGARHWEQDKDSTIYIGNLDERVTDALVWELFLQAGRIVNVHLPKDRVTQTHQGYGFVEFTSEEDAEYAARIMNQVRLYGKPIRVNKASADKQKSVEVGAELFVGNLDPMVDERMLYETFGRFGTLVAAPKIARDENNLSKGYGFVSFADFESSDDAIANMNGQYLMNKEVTVQYAYKKDGKGERHGDQAERMLAAQAKAHGVQPTPATIPLGGPPAYGGVPPTPTTPAGFGAPAHGPPAGNYQAVPPPVHARPPPPPVAPLAAPPSGLPARPPPSQAGYGGPQGYMPPGFNNQMPAPYPPPQPNALPGAFAPPPGFGGPQAGTMPPAQPVMPPAGFSGYGIRK
ncbi:Spliceosome-associated protein 49 [Exophiala dermatitidis]|uniref:Nucleolin n=2 Tax=Exophiala dermatitidis TaxID=5970 RepID=H6BYJ0_EXODN|nr:nucleolin [Exophiala dermatitidis NIH/UT8656]KAJ4520241.1 Spliceosome-associated protein 49 [Exophiala dermatitidis]EHY56703.1 nucleolin [Exophiala dermatitidis NIH/UT8656]KAJ4524096.1 Spliceosome-associated protein 49 [Exophiala dermatitidis]KAJ4525632.1 Spliceosome-associated protein 49 [Exophiala dermatitidis]KAJ4536949.1 Spliceosome-associated protein 49 [Exophiala dermatitidis]